MFYYLFPESKNQFIHVGYNHAVFLLDKMLGERFFVEENLSTKARFYCNLPYHTNGKKLKGKFPLVLYTMFETTEIPKSWVKYLNKYVDVLLVPSEWNREIFIKSGVKMPVFVVRLGYDPDEYDLVPKTRNLDKFVFMWQGVCHDRGGRKGYDLAIDSFKELKREGYLGDDAKLILKTVPQKGQHLELDLDDDSIIINRCIKSTEEMKQMYSSVDCCINPTQGEGFGYIPLEQMAMGKPIIAPMWSIPYLTSGHEMLTFIPVDYRLKKSNLSWNHKSIHVSLNGIVMNFGGLAWELRFLPKRCMELRSETGKAIKIPGIKCVHNEKKFTSIVLLFNKIWNCIARLHKRSGLIVNRKRIPKIINFENPGLGAYIDKEDLKDKMVWAYSHQDSIKEIGLKAHEYVSKHWTVDNILTDYLKIESHIEQIVDQRRRT